MTLISPIHRKPKSPTLIIEPSRGWGHLGLAELWQYRELTLFFIWRDIKGRYRQTALGPIWMLLNPLMSMVLYSVIFGELAHLPSEGVPYPIFTYVALLPWTYFSGAASSAVGSLSSQMGVISKVYFPRLIVPLTSTIAALVDLAISFLILFGMMFFYGIMPSVRIIALPFYLLLAMLTALSIGLWSAALAVRFRDVGRVIGMGLGFAKYATPVAYSATLVPESWFWLYQLNPLYWVIEGFRWALLGTVGQPPQAYMLFSLIPVLLLFISGAYVFRRTERTIVDLL
jgi:lipopolysaccharide transport system permease protein